MHPPPLPLRAAPRGHTRGRGPDKASWDCPWGFICRQNEGGVSRLIGHSLPHQKHDKDTRISHEHEIASPHAPSRSQLNTPNLAAPVHRGCFPTEELPDLADLHQPPHNNCSLSAAPAPMDHGFVGLNFPIPPLLLFSRRGNNHRDKDCVSRGGASPVGAVPLCGTFIRTEATSLVGWL